MSVEFIIQVIAALMLGIGGIFAIIGGIGLMRFPDVFTRLHAGSITDTLAPLLIIGGLVLLVGFDLLTFKLLAICFSCSSPPPLPPTRRPERRWPPACNHLVKTPARQGRRHRNPN